MGWRVDQRYDDDRRASWHALPLRERDAWGRIAFVLIGMALIVAIAVSRI